MASVSKGKRGSPKALSKTSAAVAQREAELAAKIKELSALLSSKGISVRREKLKQGNGWRAMSGSCRLETEQIVFVDPRLSLQDQVEFLLARVQVLAGGEASTKQAILSPVQSVVQSSEPQSSEQVHSVPPSSHSSSKLSAVE
jgi:hypothetical protein